MMGVLEADQSISFESIKEKLAEMIAIVKADPAVENVVGFTGSGGGPSGGDQFSAGFRCAETALRAQNRH